MNNAITANGWTSDANSFFEIFTPLSDGTVTAITNSTTGICGIHYFPDPAFGHVLDLGVPSSCDPGSPYPNARLIDEAINTSSHEIMETVTDPLGNAWFFETPMPGLLVNTEQRPVGGWARQRAQSRPRPLVAKSGSRSFIQVSKTVQANLVLLEDDADGAFAGMAQAQFWVGGHILRQVVDAPVGLPGPAGSTSDGFWQASTRSRAWMSAWYRRGGGHLGRSLSPSRRCLGETTAPQPDGADRQTQLLGDGAIDLTVSGAQDDLRAVGILLRGGTGSDTALQFGTLGRQQPNTSTTRFGHANAGFRCCPSQPAVLRMYSRCASINRKR